MIEIISIIVLIVILIIVFKIFKLDNKNKKKIKYSKKHVNEISFLKFAKFYGNKYKSNPYFYKNIEKILLMINKDVVRDLNVIGKTINNEDVDYVIMLIRYLRNKRLICDVAIDKKNLKLVCCSDLEKELLKKYEQFIYDSHLQIDDMIPIISNPNKLSKEDLKKQTIKELIYLDKKCLLNGLRINLKDNSIIYYSVEKKKLDKAGIEVVVCQNCGAITYKRKEEKQKECDYCHCNVEKKMEK